MIILFLLSEKKKKVQYIEYRFIVYSATHVSGSLRQPQVGPRLIHKRQKNRKNIDQ